MTLAELVALYPVFGKLPGDLPRRVADGMQMMTVPAATTVFDEHQACRGFPFVLQGAIRVVKQSASGRELPLYRVVAGESCSRGYRSKPRGAEGGGGAVFETAGVAQDEA